MNLKKPNIKLPHGGKKVWQNGLYATLLTVAVLVVVILVNLVAQALPSKYTELDISTSAMFTLSDTTKTFLHELDRDVTVYYLAQTGQEDTNVTRLLDRYADETSHFSWEQRDPVLYPTFAQQYSGASTGSLVLVCGENNKVVSYGNLYEMDMDAYYTNYSQEYNFNAENEITSALAQVTRTAAYTLYELTGHGELALDTDFTETLTNAGVTVQQLNLTTAGSIPQDAAALLINAPTADITADEATQLGDYLANGGKILAATDMTIATPNLDGLMETYGMTRQTGLLIETDGNNYPYGYPQTYLLPNVNSNEVTAGVGSGMMVFAPIAQGITYDTDSPDYEYTALLSTSATSYAMQDYATAETAQKADTDPEGSFDLAVAAQSSATGGKLVWVNCGNVFNSTINERVSGGNAQLLGSIANWFTGEQTTAVIDAKSMSAATLTVPAIAIVGLGLLFTIVLPLVCIIAGIVVCVVRRRR